MKRLTTLELFRNNGARKIIAEEAINVIQEKMQNKIRAEIRRVALEVIGE